MHTTITAIKWIKTAGDTPRQFIVPSDDSFHKETDKIMGVALATKCTDGKGECITSMTGVCSDEMRCKPVYPPPSAVPTVVYICVTKTCSFYGCTYCVSLSFECVSLSSDVISFQELKDFMANPPDGCKLSVGKNIRQEQLSNKGQQRLDDSSGCFLVLTPKGFSQTRFRYRYATRQDVHKGALLVMYLARSSFQFLRGLRGENESVKNKSIL